LSAADIDFQEAASWENATFSPEPPAFALMYALYADMPRDGLPAAFSAFRRAFAF
jgi:hypothetical protein